MERRRRLRDLLARAAAELLAHVLGNEPLPRHHVERRGDVLAVLGELGAAAPLARSGRRRVHDPPARQVIGEVPPRRPAPHKALDPDAGALRFDLVFARRRGRFLELQLQLFEQALTALRAPTKHRALHLLDQEAADARSAPL